MSILSRARINELIERGKIALTPLRKEDIQPNSIDVTLGREVAVYKSVTMVRSCLERTDSFYSSACIEPYSTPSLIPPYLDPKKSNEVNKFVMDESGWLVKPGILYLMHVNEASYAPEHVMTITGKSSLARLGLIIHYTAAHAETGFNGQFTLEVSANNHAIRLYPDMYIGQILFQTVEGVVSDYSDRGHYVRDKALGAQPSLSWKQFDERGSTPKANTRG
jgi:dCTP deaminase